MNVHLSAVFDDFVVGLLKTGHYQTQSEVLREGLRLLKEREELKQLRLAELRQRDRCRQPAGRSGRVRGRSGGLRQNPAAQRPAETRQGMKRFVLTPRAEQGVSDIWDYIANDNVAAADRVWMLWKQP